MRCCGSQMVPARLRRFRPRGWYIVKVYACMRCGKCVAVDVKRGGLMDVRPGRRG